MTEVEDLMEILVEMNSLKPLIIDIVTDEQAGAIEKHIGDFPGSTLHCKHSYERKTT